MNDIFDNLIFLYIRNNKDFLENVIKRSIEEEFSYNFINYKIMNLRLDTFINPNNKNIDKYFLQVFSKLNISEVSYDKTIEIPMMIQN